jgi:flagellar L-ring protein precursor FlgH
VKTGGGRTGMILRDLISSDRRRILFLAALLSLTALLAPVLEGQEKSKSKGDKQKDKARDGLADYVRKVSVNAPAATPGTLGSLWTDNGRLANMVADYKASRVGDLVTINITQNLSASSTGDVATNRAFSATSGITALPGQLKTAGVANLFSPNSTQALTGKGQSTSQTSLSTTLTGRVAAVLPTGTLVVEAEREIMMNQEHETVILRGLVRPGDLDATNTVLSNSVGDLEIEVKSKGVISESTRAPNPIMKWILRILNF